MKSTFFTIALAACQVFVTTASVVKRTTVNDVATVGYATLNGGTTGGSGGTTTTVTTLDALTAAVTGNTKKIVLISGTITGNAVVEIGSNTSVIGKTGSSLVGVGLRVLNEANVIIRNVKISKVLASAGDAIGVQASSQVWDFYDGLLDITHGVTGITVTNSFLNTHWKASLIGHSDSNGAEDVAITVTMANNHWFNLNSRTPSFRFGHGHIFNNFYDTIGSGVDTRDGAQLLVENNVFTNTNKCIFPDDTGFAVATGNDFGAKGTNTGTYLSLRMFRSLIGIQLSVQASVAGLWKKKSTMLLSSVLLPPLITSACIFVVSATPVPPATSTLNVTVFGTSISAYAAANIRKLEDGAYHFVNAAGETLLIVNRDAPN
ncbi:pectin lyase fold/virulence factor [Mycena vulgaris]|nr:pectin lyase fold/virulence factor [Mycena vulgaris]